MGYSQKNTARYIALRDITKHLQSEMMKYKENQIIYSQDNYIVNVRYMSMSFVAKEITRMNRELGLHRINMDRTNMSRYKTTLK